MTAKHTPGPWGLSDETVRDGLRSVYVHAAPEGLLAIVRVEHQGRFYGEANARLIAAAPEMYDALADTLRILEAVKLSAGLGAKQVARMEAAKAALAKAGA